MSTKSILTNFQKNVSYLVQVHIVSVQEKLSYLGNKNIRMSEGPEWLVEENSKRTCNYNVAA